MNHILYGGEEKALAKRILAAVLDDMEESVVPFLSSSTGSLESHAHDAQERMHLCSAYTQFLLLLSRSNEGIRLLRVQMRLEPGQQDEPSRWSQSAIGCMISLLDSILAFAVRCGEGGNVTPKASCLAGPLNAIVEQ